MKTIFTLFVSFLSLAATAQAPEPAMLWLHVIGGDGGDLVTPYVTKTPDGGFIMSLETTSITGPIDTLCGISNPEMIFQKYNSDGSILEWNKCYAGNSSVYMFLTTGGEFVLAGLGLMSTHTFFIHKENAAGSVLWSKSYGDSAEAIIKSMIPVNDGGYVILGQTNYTNTDFPTHYGSWMNANFAVLKIDSNGNKIWSRVLGGSDEQLSASVVVAPNGGCYVVGSTRSNDFDCTGNHGGADAYIARLDIDGNVLWHNDLGGAGNDGGGGTYAYPDGKGGAIIATISGSSDGDVTHQINPGGYNIWLLEVDSNNHIVWNNCFGGGGQEFPNSVCRAIDGSIWIAGYSNIKAGEVNTNYGRQDAWFVHADSAGNFLSAKVIGSSGQDEGYMVYPLSNGNVIAGGNYANGGGAFPNISWGGGDAFEAVFSPLTTDIHRVNIQWPRIYPNPAHGVTSIELEQNAISGYQIRISNVTGGQVYYDKVSGNVRRINVLIKDWQAGLYFVEITGENGYNQMQKLIVK